MRRGARRRARYENALEVKFGKYIQSRARILLHV